MVKELVRERIEAGAASPRRRRPLDLSAPFLRRHCVEQMAGVGAAAERNTETERGVEAEPAKAKRSTESALGVHLTLPVAGGGFTGGRSNDAEDGGR